METKPTPAVPDAPRLGARLFHNANRVVGLALLAVTFWAFLPAVDNEFVRYDDIDYVMANHTVQRGLSWDGLVWAFSSTTAANWHPLTWLSHMLDCQLFGLNPAGHHLTSILLHAVNTLLVFVLLHRMTGATGRSFLVAACFGWHPLRVESVAWAAERKDVLSAFFGLLTLLAYARFAQFKVQNSKFKYGREVWYGSALVLFALGLMSKPMLVTWPFVLLLLDFWPLRRMGDAVHDFRLVKLVGLVREKLPFFLLSAVASVVTFVVQRDAGAVDAVMSLSYRFSNALVAGMRYLGKLFWPVDLAFFYPLPTHWPALTVVFAGLLLLGISALAVAQRHRIPGLITGWLWFLGTLVPVIGLVQVGGQSIADRYTYLPSIGLWIALVWSVQQYLGTRTPLLRAVNLTAGVCLLLGLFLTREQTRQWKNAESLARHALAVTRNNHLAHDLLGEVFEERGLYAEALQERYAALQIKPNYAPAHNNLGVVLQKQNRLVEAIEHFEQALRLRPRYPEAHYNLAAAFEKAGRPNDAVREYERALALRPDYADAHYNLGLLLGRLGRLDDAIVQFQETIRINPGAADAYNNLGVTLDRLGRPADAILQYQLAIQVSPDFARAHFNLGVALAGTGQLAAARTQFEEALRLKPDYAEAQTNLSSVLLLLNVPPGKP